MTPTELDGFRQQLYHLGRRLKGDVSSLSIEALRGVGGDHSGGLSDMPVHPADLGTDAFDQEVALCLLENQDQQLEEVVGALRRFDEGTFGSCENCHQPISRERLQALPFARCCIQCARLEDGKVTG